MVDCGKVQLDAMGAFWQAAQLGMGDDWVKSQMDMVQDCVKAQPGDMQLCKTAYFEEAYLEMTASCKK
jgi:hypothetical protein